MKRLIAAWYNRSPYLVLLRPISMLFGALSASRKWLYDTGMKKAYQPGIPVIVTGNITVGGTGKTPLVIYLAKQLVQAGFRPGIISRGYGSKAEQYPYHVKKDSAWLESGDEALVIARNCDCPIVIDADRAAAARDLEQFYDCDVIISDDGLQHYALARDIEIAVIDGRRGFGNGRLLPEGPLREKPGRLDSVNFLVFNGAVSSMDLGKPSYSMRVTPHALCQVRNHVEYPLEHLISYDQGDSHRDQGDSRRNEVHAIAGIGNPERFFGSLCAVGFDIITHIFDDHHSFTAEDIHFDDELNVVMTEKDAVKCQEFATDRHWYLKVEAALDENFFPDLLQMLKVVQQARTRNGTKHG